MQTSAHMLRIGRRGLPFEFAMAAKDLAHSSERLGLAWSLASHDVVSRYRGSILGPFWITASMGLMVLGIGLLYAQLFKMSVREFMPFVALGIVFFGTITGIIVEGCDTFTRAAGMLSQTSIPMFTFVWRTIFRNVINLGHHLLIVVAVLTYYDFWREAHLAYAVFGVVLLLLNAGWMSMVVGIASARFRDIPQIIGSVMQFAVFMTPVFWRPDQIERSHLVLALNPFKHMLEAVRSPLLGDMPPADTYLVLTVLALAGWGGTFALFTRTRRRIVHYL